MYCMNLQKSVYSKHLLIKKMFLFIFLFFIVQNNSAYAQQKDTTDAAKNAQLLREDLARKRRVKKAARRKKFLSTLPKNHNAKTATLLALIPGVGQIYNRRYWKLPIVYSGLGVLGYFTINSYIEYGCFRTAYLHAVDDDPTTNYKCTLTSDTVARNLKIYRDNAQESAELFVIGLTLFYGLTIIDAFVDAHLLHFDIDDNLSIQIEPKINYNFASRNFVPSIGLSVFPKMRKMKVLPVYF